MDLQIWWMIAIVALGAIAGCGASTPGKVSVAKIAEAEPSTAPTDQDPAIEIPTSTMWIAAQDRRPLTCLNALYTDQDEGHGTLGAFLDRPTVLTFFYTRCENTQKCSAAVASLGSLKRALAGNGMAARVHLLAISYEPQWDDPARLKRFARDRGLVLDECAKAVRLDEQFQPRVIKELRAPVGYNGGWVNSHGIELYLLDARGRVARTYHTLLRHNDAVIADLKRLLAEERY
jgi:cytochrome oxidase Cu insertion factor (SCO1/SenC/PrrC family)